MATINFLYRSTKDEAPLLVKLRYNRKGKSLNHTTPIKLTVTKNYWEVAQYDIKRNDTELKNDKIELDKKLLLIEKHLVEALKGVDVNSLSKQWLIDRVDEFYNPTPAEGEEVNKTIIDWIQKIVDEAPYRDNAKGGIGLSKSRVDSYKQLAVMFKEFQGKKSYNVLDVNKKVFEKFKTHLLGKKNYAPTYVSKKLADLKTVCKDAASNGVAISHEVLGVKNKKVSPYDDDMNVIPLTMDDIIKIEEVELTSVALINARKWLILGAFTGQRGEALIERVVVKNFRPYGSGYEIRITQKKGNKNVRIPVLPRVRKIYEEGLPYLVSTQKLRKHFKKICKLAGIDEPTVGRITEAIPGESGDKKIRRGVKKERPKYEYVGLHTLRRTFACIHEGQLDREIIMKVTGHKKLETYLQYVNIDGNDHLDAFLDYYEKEELKSQKRSNLSVVRKEDIKAVT